MTSFMTRALALAALIVFAGTTYAADTIPTVQTGLEQVQAQKRTAYDAVLAQFDRAIAAAPDDASIGVARCEYINQFTDDEAGDWIEGAEEQFAACTDALHERWPAAPAVQLFELEQAWGEDAVELADKLEASVHDWPAPLRMRAFARLSDVYDDADATRAGEFAVHAAKLGDVDSAARAIKSLVARKEFEQATRLLDTMAVPSEAWTARRIVTAALALPDKQAAWRAVQRFEKGGLEGLSPAVIASAQLRAGDVAGARKRLGKEKVEGFENEKFAFDVAIAARDADAALAYVDVSDMANANTQLGRFAVLATTMPSSLFSVPMMALLFGVLAMVVFLTLVAGMALVPVHYRGLARRLRHLSTPPLFERASLRRAWFGVSVALIVPTLAIFAFSPHAVEALLGGESTSGMFDGMLWGTVLGLICLVPILLGMPRRELLGDATVWRAWKRVLGAWLVLMAVTIVQALFHRWSGGGGETLQTQMVETMVGEGNVALGGIGSLLLIGVLGPVFEELVFRGLLLGGLARHLSFRWANGLQALAFAVAHDDPPRFVFYLAMGLLTGWLVKSTRSLGPAIALHVINNVLFVTLTRV